MRERVEIADVAQVYQLWHEYAAACNTGDVERWLALWSDDGLQMLPTDAQRGRDTEVCEEQPALLGWGHATNLTLQPDVVQILGSWAYSHGTYVYDRMPKQGGPLERVSGQFLSILEKQVDGSWKLAIDCRNGGRPEASVGEGTAEFVGGGDAIGSTVRKVQQHSGKVAP